MKARDRSCFFSSVLVITALLSCGCAGQADAPENPNPPETTEMAESAHVHHAIDYIEFTVSDMAEAKRFYSAAFGWEFNEYGPDYAGIRKGDGEAGGLRSDIEVVTGGPLVILFSEDLAATLALVREAGGKIVKEPYGFPGGHRFEFQDPSGNHLAVYAVD